MLRGVPVLGTTDEFEAVIADLDRRMQRPRHLIFTAPLSSFKGNTVERLIAQADRMGMAVSRLNPATELRNTRVASAFELRPIELTDLLERPQAALDVAALQRFIRDRRVLVTGAGGSIGSELARQVAALGPSQLIVVDNSEFNLYSIDLDLAENFSGVARSAHLCDVRDARRLDNIFAQHKPELVFHAAALKHVPMVELNPCEGVLTNVCGTMNVAEAAKRWGALGMVQISTDKVVNSPNVMGATKRLAELYCQSLDLECAKASLAPPRFVTVRFGNVLGSSGSLIPLFKRQLARGGPLTVTHPEMKRFFMTIREAVELTLQASAYAVEKKLGSGEIFVLDMGEPIKIIDIARRMIRLAGFTPDQDMQIEIVGCRPGEKLFEELFDETEKRVAPPVPGVFGAVPTPVPLPVLYDAFKRLRAFASDGDTAGVFDTMRGILPGFRTAGSRPKATAERQTNSKDKRQPHSGISAQAGHRDKIGYGNLWQPVLANSAEIGLGGCGLWPFSCRSSVGLRSATRRSGPRDSGSGGSLLLYQIGDGWDLCLGLFGRSRQSARARAMLGRPSVGCSRQERPQLVRPSCVSMR